MQNNGGDSAGFSSRAVGGSVRGPQLPGLAELEPEFQLENDKDT